MNSRDTHLKNQLVYKIFKIQYPKNIQIIGFMQNYFSFCRKFKSNIKKLVKIIDKLGECELLCSSATTS